MLSPSAHSLEYIPQLVPWCSFSVLSDIWLSLSEDENHCISLESLHTLSLPVTVTQSKPDLFSQSMRESFEAIMSLNPLVLCGLWWCAVYLFTCFPPPIPVCVVLVIIIANNEGIPSVVYLYSPTRPPANTPSSSIVCRTWRSFQFHSIRNTDIRIV